MAVLAKSRALHWVGGGGTGTNLIIRSGQIFGDLAGFVLKKNGAHLFELLVVLLVVRHDLKRWGERGNKKEKGSWWSSKWMDGEREAVERNLKI